MYSNQLLSTHHVSFFTFTPVWVDFLSLCWFSFMWKKYVALPMGYVCFFYYTKCHLLLNEFCKVLQTCRGNKPFTYTVLFSFLFCMYGLFCYWSFSIMTCLNELQPKPYSTLFCWQRICQIFQFALLAVV